MRLGMEMRLEQGLRLSSEQRLKCEQLLKLESQLHHEPFEAVRGLEGMHAANELLKERKSVGILIGGLAEEVWKGDKTRTELENHKDVDVLVLSKDFQLDGEFREVLIGGYRKKMCSPRNHEFTRIKTEKCRGTVV